MTSLIDVIFLLLLFFMLSSTFSRFAEVELAPAGGGVPQQADNKPVFLKLSPDSIALNGSAQTFEDLPAALSSQADSPSIVLVSMHKDVTSQRLTDLLVVLRGVSGITVTVLGAS